MYVATHLVARYMEISVYLATKHLVRYMEISMYPATKFVAKYMESSSIVVGGAHFYQIIFPNLFPNLSSTVIIL